MKVKTHGDGFSVQVAPLRGRQLVGRCLTVSASRNRKEVTLAMTNPMIVKPLELWEIGERMKNLAGCLEPLVNLLALETLPPAAVVAQGSRWWPSEAAVPPQEAR